MPTVVIDASVALKWFLADEAGRPEALRLRDAIVRATVDAVAPSHMSFELAAGLLRAVRRGRLPPEEIESSLDAVADLEIARVEPSSIVGRATRLARRLGLSVHDAAYLAAAISAGGTLITADELLRDASRAAGYEVISLEELSGDLA